MAHLCRLTLKNGQCFFILGVLNLFCCFLLHMWLPVSKLITSSPFGLSCCKLSKNEKFNGKSNRRINIVLKNAFFIERLWYKTFNFVHTFVPYGTFIKNNYQFFRFHKQTRHMYFYLVVTAHTVCAGNDFLSHMPPELASMTQGWASMAPEWASTAPRWASIATGQAFMESLHTSKVTSMVSWVRLHGSMPS